jgi:signal transduction histidine kinase
MRVRACIAALLGLGAAWAAVAQDQSLQRLSAAEATLRPDGQSEQQRRVELRFRWDDAFPGEGGSASYRIPLPPASDAAPRSLLIERVGNQAVLSLDGQVVQRLGWRAGQAFDAGKAPYRLELPRTAAELRLDTDVQPQRSGGLSPLWLGPSSAIEARYAQRWFRDQTLPAAYALSLLLIGGLAAGLWWRQRDALYGVFSLAALSGSVRHIDRAWTEVPPLPWLAWGALLAVTYGCHLLFIARFVVLAVDRNPRWLKRASYGVLAAVVVLPVLSFALGRPALWTATLALMLLLGLACFYVVLRAALASRRRSAWLVLVLGGLLILAGAHDLLTVRMGLAATGRDPLAPHALMAFVLVLAGIVVERYSASVREVRMLNQNLERRIAERERELSSAFEALREQREEQAAMQERQRIMRDLHDGVGAQLVGLLDLSRGGGADAVQIEQQVRGALDELRMAVDAMQPMHGDLATVLATLRWRLQPRLKAAGIDVVWDVTSLPTLHNLSPSAVLQVQRILLQAFTNMIQHARATSVEVGARLIERDGERQVCLSVADNGVGFDCAQAGHGHGLANMRLRAQAIGARLHIESAANAGTRVRLDWPVDSAKP